MTMPSPDQPFQGTIKIDPDEAGGLFTVGSKPLEKSVWIIANGDENIRGLIIESGTIRHRA